MLHHISIKNLFGLYTYELGPLFNVDSPVRFITGPNGYGKSTILSMISHLLCCEFSYFRMLSFSEIQFKFDDKIILLHKIGQTVKDFTEDVSKLQNNIVGDVTFRLIDNKYDTQDAFFQLSLADNSIIDNGRTEIEMFLNGEAHYYIRDQRLLKDDTWTRDTENHLSSSNAVNVNALLLKDMMINYKNRLSSIISIQNFSMSNKPLSKDTYERRKAELTSDLDKLKLYRLVDDGFNLLLYQEEAVPIMWAFLSIAESALVYAKPLLDKINLFKEIIDRSDFADKELQISPEFGYRFVSKNQDRTLLEGSDLSSGEQHILIQTYELIFNAPEGSLVLIDEPEMSFHVIWQMDYLKNITKIAKQNNLQCLVATHSPQIFDSMWDLTFDLYDIAHPQIED